MNFADIKTSASIFLDANIFVYNFGPDPSYGPACRALLERIESGEIKGYTSAHVMHDVAHRVMTLEACQTFGWPYPGIAQRLRKHPNDLSKLKGFRKALDEIVAIGVEVLLVTQNDILLAADLSIRHGLLSGDSLVVAAMQTRQLNNLASVDADFDRVPGIVRYAP